MKTLEFTCGGLHTGEPPHIILSEDPMPLTQNCCFVELTPHQFILGVDEGSRILRFAAGLDAVFLDSQNGLLTLWSTPEVRRTGGISLIQIRLNAQQTGRLEPLIGAFVPS